MAVSWLVSGPACSAHLPALGLIFLIQRRAEGRKRALQKSFSANLCVTSQQPRPVPFIWSMVFPATVDEPNTPMHPRRLWRSVTSLSATLPAFKHTADVYLT